MPKKITTEQELAHLRDVTTALLEACRSTVTTLRITRLPRLDNRVAPHDQLLGLAERSLVAAIALAGPVVAPTEPTTECDHPWHDNPALIFPCPSCGVGPQVED